jgi:hypothetical protein
VIPRRYFRLGKPVPTEEGGTIGLAVGGRPMSFRLMVIDGADEGRFYLLPDDGKLVIGNRQNQGGICLNDLYAARVHCEVAVAAGHVTVSAHDTPNGTLINGKKITQQELQVGEIVRVGNSRLRLDKADDAAVWGAGEKIEQPTAVPRVKGDQLDNLSGHPLGHFELGAVLGRGHCGVVFRARDVKKNQEVALKVLDPAFPAADQEMQVFIKALKTRLALNHPKLVSIHGAGKSGPYCWIAQELVEGENLSHALQRYVAAKKLKWRRALNLALDVGRALVFLHQHHIRHGNITPHNILIHSANESAKLNDVLFQTALEGSALQAKTMEKKFLAEVPYLAPEQADPSNNWVDDLSDLYSLGVVVYALLTGKAPFVADSPEETLRLIREDLPIKPTKVQKSIPDQFQAAVLKMLAKHPEERYPTAAMMVADMEKIGAETS